MNLQKIAIWNDCLNIFNFVSQVDDLIECESEFFVDGHRYRARLYNSVSDYPVTRASMGLAGHSADQGEQGFSTSLFNCDRTTTCMGSVCGNMKRITLLKIQLVYSFILM